MPWVPYALFTVGTVTQMKAQREAGEAAEEQSQREAAWREFNAKLEEREAKEVQESAASEEQKFRKGGERLKARRRTQAGQAGILPIGSFELVSRETVDELEMDALEIRRGGTIGAQGLTAAAQLSRFGAKSALLRGKAARRAGWTGALATGLSGAAQLGFQATK